MILNHSKKKRSVISLDTITEMYSKDITLLFVYGDLISCTTPACFSTFYRCAMVLTLVENFNFLCTCLLTFL